jgi:receptor expression-enhancing protein 5/6
MVTLWQIVVQVHNFAGPLVMLVYPLYASVQAIESPFKEDDTQWLTYWVLYSFLQLIELGFDRILSWIPIWYTVKLVAICWLVLPQFHGAAFLYDNYVKKYVGAANATKNEKLTPKQRQLIEQMSPQARASVSAFISEYGPGAFDSVIQTATSEAVKNRSSFDGEST